MKMEKLNDYQIRFLLSRQDLKDRNITFGDLFRHSDKLQGLVREIMKLASERINFNVTENPVMVEARPHPEGMVLIVSRTPEKTDNLITDEYKRHLANLYNDFIDRKLFEAPAGLPFDDLDRHNAENDTVGLVFAFDDISKLIAACGLCADMYSGSSMLCKLKDEYYLVLNCGSSTFNPSVSACLAEYGELKHKLDGKAYLLPEYGDVIIEKNAITSLANC